MDFKMPPTEKIYEAYSAIADERVILKENEAEVTSSDLSKKYIVAWRNEVYSSNDNGSYWQGYIGYPIIAVLMLQGKLPLKMEYARYFREINWKQINAEYKNKYSEAVNYILAQLSDQGINCEEIEREIKDIYAKISELKISTKRSKYRPPK